MGFEQILRLAIGRLRGVFYFGGCGLADSGATDAPNALGISLAPKALSRHIAKQETGKIQLMFEAYI